VAAIPVGKEGEEMTDTKDDWTGVESLKTNELGLDADECRAMCDVPPLSPQSPDERQEGRH
jgi:hypothetical protein